MRDRRPSVTHVVWAFFLMWVIAPAVALAQSYYCSTCGRGFSHPGRAQTHVEKKHDNEGQVRSYATDGTYISETDKRCPRCGKHCENQAHLRNHMAQCSARKVGGQREAPQGSEAIPYHCRHCKKSFPTHVDAARHAAQCASAPARKDGPRNAGARIDRPVADPEDDVIILENGEKFVGDVQFMTEDSVTLKTPSGADVTFTKKQVRDILGIRATKMLRAVKEGKGSQVAPENKKPD